MYPFASNDHPTRTHADYLHAAREALQRSQNGKEVSVDGIKGISILLKIFNYPDQILLDYMHLCCLGHLPSLARRWCKLLTKSRIGSIDEILFNLQLPHNINVIFLESLSMSDQWKAKNGRLFILNVGVPIVTLHLPKLFASHFVIYSMAIKILHSPLSSAEIDFAHALLSYYCKTAAFVHGPSIEIFSLHAHIHLSDQVRYDD